MELNKMFTTCWCAHCFGKCHDPLELPGITNLFRTDEPQTTQKLIIDTITDKTKLFRTWPQKLIIEGRNMNIRELSRMTLRQINELEEKVSSAKIVARQKERESLIEKVNTMLVESGFTLRDIYPQFKNRRRNKKAH